MLTNDFEGTFVKIFEDRLFFFHGKIPVDCGARISVVNERPAYLNHGPFRVAINKGEVLVKHFVHSKNVVDSPITLRVQNVVVS